MTSWTWVPEPVKGQPFDRPFAFALVTLDGADAPLLHALDVASPDDVTTGMRVRVRWRRGAGRARSPTSSASRPRRARQRSEPRAEPPDGGPGHRHRGPDRARLPLRRLARRSRCSTPRSSEGKLVGQRCPTCGKVYVPPRSACPADGTPTAEEVELPDTGTVTTFCIVNVPFLGQRITPPYVSAYILLDGADIAFLHLILDIPAEEVRMGMRVKAVWKPREEWGTTIENISHFAPTGEPDADYETYRNHL